MAEDLRTLLVETRREKFKITIPAEWKVTFGKPIGRAGGYEEDRELRLYEGDTRQRACFTGVVSFRDLSIPMVRLVVSESGTETWEDDGEGTTQRSVKRKRTVKEVGA